jgi:hypothetical protein
MENDSWNRDVCVVLVLVLNFFSTHSVRLLLPSGYTFLKVGTCYSLRVHHSCCTLLTISNIIE